jgi:hypothetical protein
MTWVNVPEDLLTHIGDWRRACEIALDAAPPSREDFDDIGYWRKQLATLDEIERQITDRKKRDDYTAWAKSMDDANRAAGVDLL